MSLTQEQVEKLLASLSKLSLENSASFTKSINSIITYMDILNEVDTTWVTPTVSSVVSENILREDAHIMSPIAAKQLLDCSGQSIIAQQIALPNIMK